MTSHRTTPKQNRGSENNHLIGYTGRGELFGGPGDEQLKGLGGAYTLKEGGWCRC
ncbi:MAG: hypothetical protein GDA36_04865 [Rhodobacteraceae bacterium]|nr:hypothetical protein [Paracoccaceae bacterium]